MALSVVIPQADSAINQTLVPATAYTSSDTAGPWPADFWSSCEITVAVTSCSGTLNVYFQKLLPDDATYDDIVSFAQWTTATYTTTGTFVASFVNGGNTINQSEDAAQTANTISTVHWGNRHRLKYVIAGTGATVTFGAYASYKR
jgi:hypothetical protein